YLWQYQATNSVDLLQVAGTPTTAFLLAAHYPATPNTFQVTAVRASDGVALWHHTAPAAGLALSGDALYTGYGGTGGTEGEGCTATGAAHVTKYRATDAQVLWDVQP